jgi:hypothetical protein
VTDEPMGKRRNVRVYAYSNEGSICEPFQDFVARMNYLLEEIPEEYRAKSEIEITTCSSYGDYIADVYVYFDHPETDEEYASRLAHEAATKEYNMRRERELFEALKLKYGDA